MATTKKTALTKTVTKKAAAKKPASVNSAAASASPGLVRVRMYRQGLGDCFLLTFPKAGGGDFHFMIDCGVVLGTADPAKKMKAVVDDIIKTTGGRVDILTATHEHWDHLSGFVQVSEMFASAAANDKDKEGKLRIGQLWLAWTEDDKNALAQKLRKEHQDKKAKLKVAAQKLKLAGMAATAAGIDQVLSFFGEGFAANGGGGGKTTTDALKALHDFTEKKPRLCQPADAPITLGDIPDFQIYVLGPPQDEALIKKTDSSTELYKDHMALALQESAWQDAIEPTGSIDELRPFDSYYCIPLSTVSNAIASTQQVEANPTLQFFDRYYFGKDSSDASPDQNWRRIDGDWLGAAVEFALQLDNATNNTSLVLAIEHKPTGKVLLFAADAQVGNWLSWQDLKWKVDGKEVTGPDLLKRAVFYKVGHHGSHNATLKAKGLETMTSDDLVAFIPVDHDMAVKKGWGKMPLDALCTALKTQTKGRVVRVDKDFDPKDADSSIRSDFENNLERTDLYYDFTLR